MVQFKGMEVTVQVAGADLKEYEDEDESSDDTPKTVSRYVESVSGAAFAVKVGIPKNYKMKGNAQLFNISADGMNGDRTLCRKSKLLKAERESFVIWSKGVKSFVRDHWERMEWQFSDIRLTEEPTLPTSQHPTPAEIASLGSITVQVYRVNVGEKKTPNKNAPKTNPQRALELTEKKLKGGSLTHRTTMGRAKRVETPNYYDTRYIDGFNSPCATFIFKYRSKRALQSLLLIPRSPSPGPMLPLEERDVDTLTPQELQELARRHQVRYRQEQRSAVKPERRVLKREREQDDDDDDTVTVIETKPKRGKARPSADVEFVDLTG